MAHNLETLPQWARTRIEQLEADLTDARRALLPANESSTEGANTFIRNGAAAAVPIGRDTEIQFRTVKGTFNVLLEHGELSVNGVASASLHSGMRFTPQSTSATRVDFT